MKVRAKTRLWGCCAVVAIICFSCANFTDLEKPKGVSVHSNGTYQVPLGGISKKMQDHLNAKQLHKKLSESMSDDDEEGSEKKFSVYDYNPNGNDTVQEFLINYELPEIPLDMGKYLKDLHFAESVNDSLSQEITIPEPEGLSFTQNIEFPDIDDLIKSNFSGEGTKDLPVVEGISGSLSNLPNIPMQIEPEFSKMSFKTGKIAIRLEPNAEPTAGYLLTLKAILYDNGAGKEIAVSEETEVARGGTLSIDLARKSFSSNLSLSFSGTASGGTVGKQNTYKVSVALEESEITRIEGLYLEDTDRCTKSVEKENELGSVSEYLLSATIQDGSMVMQCALPSGWENVRAELADGFTIGGALQSSITSAQLTDGGTDGYLLNKSVSLGGKTLVTDSPLQVGGNIRFVLQNATLDFEGGKPNLVLKCDATLGMLGPAQLKLDKLQIESQKIEKKLNDTVENYIKSATVTEVAIVGTIETTLDADELNLEIVGSSEAFKIGGDAPLITDPPLNIADSTQSIDIYKCAKDDCEKGHTENWSGVKFEPANLDTNEDGEHVIDFDVIMKLIGERTDDDIEFIELNTLKLGETYSITPNLDFDFDWEEITLNTSEGVATTGDVDTGLNLNELITDFFEGKDNADDIQEIIDKITFAGIEAYVYITRPATSDALAKLDEFSGVLVAQYGEEGDETKKMVLGSLKTDEIDIEDPETFDSEPLKVIEKIDFDALIEGTTQKEKENRMITKDLFANSTLYSAQTNDGALCEILNEKPDGLTFLYNIGLASSGSDDEITLTKSEVDDINAQDGEGAAAINMTLAIRLPFQLCIGKIQYASDGTPAGVEGIEISDVMGLFSDSNDKDLFNRDEPGDDEDSLTENIDKFSEMVRTVKCHYKFTNTIGMDISAGFLAKNSDGKTYIDKAIAVDDREHTLELSSGDIQEAVKAENYPFVPTIRFSIAPSKLTTDTNGKPALQPIKVPRTAAFYASAVAEVNLDGSYEYEF